MKLASIILAGGSGIRLWPLSVSQEPKACLRITDSEFSLLQETIKRTAELDISYSLVVCNEEHKLLVAKQIQEIGEGQVDIIVENKGFDTAPAIAIAAMEILSKEIEDVALLILPADHVIKDIDVFKKAVCQATHMAQEDKLVAFGVPPTYPETEYGYIRCGKGFTVKKFIEKPSLEIAKKYLASGDCLWNSGIFLFKPKVYLNELKKYRENTYNIVRKAYKNRVINEKFINVNINDSSNLKAESIDYAVMEHTKKAKFFPLKCEWLDLGNWEAIYNYLEKDVDRNVVIGNVVYEDVSDSYIHSGCRTIYAVGVSGLIIVETKEVVLVLNKENARSLKGFLKNKVL